MEPLLDRSSGSRRGVPDPHVVRVVEAGPRHHARDPHTLSHQPRPVSGRGYDVVVMVALRQNVPGLRLSGAAWRRQLAGRLTRGLEECPDLARRISNRPTNLIRVSELLALYRAGR